MRGRMRIQSEEGFGLPTAILGVIVFAALALLGIALTRQEVRTQVRVTSRSAAFHAAEAGLAQGLENWNRPGVLEMGESWVVDEGTLPGGSSYRVVATAMDDGSTVQALFAIQSEGRAPNGTSQRAGLLAATVAPGHPVGGAIKAIGQVRVVGKADVDGWDSVPSPWNGNCPPPTGGLPGALMSDTSKVAKVGAAKIDGDPSVDEQSDTTGWFNFGHLTYEQVTARADHQFPGGTNISSGPAPTLNGDGSCNMSDKYNWGEPLDVSHPCYGWFPIIHVTGDLTAAGNGMGQGILMVDGDLSICGGFTFYGIVVARGRIKSCGSGFKIYGGAVSGESELNPGGGAVAGANKLQYSHCVVDRVLSRSKAARPDPLTERPWFQTR